MVSISGLYEDLVELINQNFYTKIEYDEKYTIYDITTNFNSYCTGTLNYTLSNINTKGYTEVVSNIDNAIINFLKSQVNTNVPIEENVRFNLKSTFADNKSLYGIIYDVVSNNNFKICIVYNPEYYKLILEDMLQ